MYRNQVPKNSNIYKEQKQNNNKNQNTHDWRKRQSKKIMMVAASNWKPNIHKYIHSSAWNFSILLFFCIMKTMPKFLPGALGLCLSNCGFLCVLLCVFYCNRLGACCMLCVHRYKYSKCYAFLIVQYLILFCMSVNSSELRVNTQFTHECGFRNSYRTFSLCIK